MRLESSNEMRMELRNGRACKESLTVVVVVAVNVVVLVDAALELPNCSRNQMKYGMMH